MKAWQRARPDGGNLCGPAIAGLLLAAALASCSASARTPALDAAAPSPPVLRLTVRSSLDGLTRLPQRVSWRAQPSVDQRDVAEVDFLVDGKLGWIEHLAPFDYGDDGNSLVTSWLSPGIRHRFTVRVISSGGQSATDTVTALVTAPVAIPSAVAGRWSRVVAAADVTRASSQEPPPPGRWSVTLDDKGWHMRDPQGGGGTFDVAYRPGALLQLRPTIETPPYPNPTNGGFCGDTDPLSTWSYVVSGSTLRLRPTATDPCGDRVAILAGTWRRAP